MNTSVMLSTGRRSGGGKEDSPENDLRQRFHVLLTLDHGGVDGRSWRFIRTTDVDKGVRKRVGDGVGDDHPCEAKENISIGSEKIKEGTHQACCSCRW